ncbi:MAG: hypothetical protein LUD47_06900, partial [Clostridia bacterium]|nr:hypothetical protein [Clostridia bacterium]
MTNTGNRKTCAACVAVAVVVAASAALATGLLSGCTGKKNVHVRDAELSGLDIYYLPTSTVDFDAVTVDVTYDNGEAETLKNAVFDETDVSDDTEFVLYTDGLYESQAAGAELEVGNHVISCRVVATDDVVELKTVTVGWDYANDLSLLMYDDPTFLYEYESRLKERTDGEREDSFYVAPDGYRVGDDNPFVFKPNLIAINYDTMELGTFSGFSATLSVTLEDDVLNPSGEPLNLDENDYVSVNDGAFSFDFTEKAVGKSFTVEVSAPAGMETGENGYVPDPISMTVSVSDGWNVYDAVDLGRMSLVSDKFDRNAFVTGSDEKSNNGGLPSEIYWDGMGGYVGKYVDEIWKDFLAEKGRGDLGPVNGMFLHGDIEVTIDDIPEEFVVTEEEAVWFGVNYEEMVGSVRDRAHIYEKNLEDDFLFDGNLFTIDCSSLKWSMTRSSLNGGVDYYEENHSGTYDGSRIGFFCVQGLTDKSADPADRKSATVENVSMLGNAIDRDDTEGKGAGSMSGIMARCAGVNVENCIIKNFLYGIYSADSAETYVNVAADRVKIYDCYDSAMLVNDSPDNRVTNSEFMRFSGPVVTAKSSAVKQNGYYGAGVTFDSNSHLESRLSGTEAWFVNNNASVIQTYITLADGIIRACSKKTVLDEDGRINLTLATHHGSGFSSGHPLLNAYFRDGDEGETVPFVLTEDMYTADMDTDVEGEELGYYNAAVTNYFVDGIDLKAAFPLPITFATNTGSIFALDVGMTGFYEPLALRNNGYAATYKDDGGESVTLPVVELKADDDQLYIYYRMNGSGLGLVVTLYDDPASVAEPEPSG